MILKLPLLVCIALGQVGSNSTDTTTTTVITTTTRTTTVPVTTTTTTTTARTTTALPIITSSFVPIQPATTTSFRPTRNTDTPVEEEKSSKSSTGVAIGLGVAAGVAILFFLIAFFCIRRNRKQDLEPLNFSAAHAPNKTESLAPGVTHTQNPSQAYNPGGYYQEEYVQVLPSAYSGQTEYYPQGQGYDQAYGQMPPHGYQQQYAVPMGYDYRRPSGSSATTGASHYSAHHAATTPPLPTNGEQFDPNVAAEPYYGEQQGPNMPSDPYYAEQQGYTNQEYFEEPQQYVQDPVDYEDHVDDQPTTVKKGEALRGASLISNVTVPNVTGKNDVIPPLPDTRFQTVERADIYQEYYTHGRNDVPQQYERKQSATRSDTGGMPRTERKLNTKRSA